MTDKRQEVTTIKCKPHGSAKNSLKAEFSGTVQGRNFGGRIADVSSAKRPERQGAKRNGCVRKLPINKNFIIDC